MRISFNIHCFFFTFVTLYLIFIKFVKISFLTAEFSQFFFLFFPYFLLARSSLAFSDFPAKYFSFSEFPVPTTSFCHSFFERNFFIQRCWLNTASVWPNCSCIFLFHFISIDLFLLLLVKNINFIYFFCFCVALRHNFTFSPSLICIVEKINLVSFENYSHFAFRSVIFFRFCFGVTHSRLIFVLRKKENV